MRRKGRLPADKRDWAYVIKNWSDFDPIDAVMLRRINDLLETHGMTIARLTGEQ